MSERAHVAIGGGIGALVRGALVLGALAAAPGGEVAVVLALNLLGALALGWLVGRARHDARWRRLVPLVGTGFLGALTTFSGLAEQLAAAVLAGRPWIALGLAVVSLGAGLAAALVGLRLGLRSGGPGAGRPGAGRPDDPAPATTRGDA